MVKNFTSTEFPKVLDKNYHGIIAPTLLAIQMKENTFTDQIISTLISDITQENLSSATTLAPTNSSSVPFDIQADDVALYFREIEPFIGKCKFGLGCKHDTEPDGAVKNAVEEGLIQEVGGIHQAFVKLREMIDAYKKR